ncbi:SET and MYND domain-containing protein 3 [Sporothrix eucalyptigena]
MKNLRLRLLAALPVVLGCQLPLSLPTAYPTSTLTDRPLLLSGPHKCVDNVCVYADSAFGGGMSVVTTEENAASLASMTTPFVEDVVSPPPFFESYILGKGIGLVANATIRHGDRLMVHSPTLLVHWKTHETLEVTLREGLYQAAVHRLPAPARRVFSRQMLIGGSDIHANIETNCFRFFLGGGHDEQAGHLGCFPPAARMNHDCSPNVHYTITNAVQSIVAVRDIRPGEELSVSYVDLMLPSAERKERLRGWGFECSCALCRDEKASAAADARLEEINALTEKMDSGDPSVTVDDGHRLVALYEQQPGLVLYIGQQAYTRAALECALFREECAVEYARKAVEALEIEMGDVTSSQDVVSMRVLATEPHTHWAWGLRATV